MAADRPHGVLLAAGAGRRMGSPKGLLRMPDGTPWVERGVRVLLEGGCAGVTVVVGAAADEVTALVPDLPGTTTTYAAHWESGLAASLAAGLDHCSQLHNCYGVDGSNCAVVNRAVVLLVDLPDVGADVVARVLGAGGAGPAVLARAAYGNRPGHPVILGRDHWAPVIAEAAGDTGAKAYLSRAGALLVECGDLATGRDVDRPWVRRGPPER
ncbi:MAG: nucleotidyltransferase family protein [Nostocoides sp.]